MSNEEVKKVTGNKNRNIIIAVAVVLVLIVVGMVFYFTSPNYRAQKQLDLGLKYLEEMNYEEAMLCFNKALEIDPKNEEILNQLASYEKDFYDAARKLGETQDYAAENEVASFMLELNQESVYGKIADAESSMGLGNVNDAKEKYEEIKNGGVEEEFIQSELEYCDVVLKVIDLCNAKKWDEVIKYLSDEKIAEIFKNNIPTEQIYNQDTAIFMAQTADGIYVYCGDLVDGVLDGKGVAMILGTNSFSVYDGAWKAGKPEGNGNLTIWNKNESIEDANVLTGLFKNGLLDGQVEASVLINGELQKIILTVKDGVVAVSEVDEDGNVVITNENADKVMQFILEYMKSSNGVVTDFIAGVPLFGGSETKLQVSNFDTEAPVLEFTLPFKKRWFNGTMGPNQIEGEPGKLGVIATDNVDGDLTDKIQMSSEYHSGYSDPYFDGVYVVVYSATDKAGNTGTLTVEFGSVCGMHAPLKVR